jgi:hypothetical protein
MEPRLPSKSKAPARRSRFCTAWPARGRDWHEKGYVRRLAALGRRVITLYARGHGKSGKPHEASDFYD